MKHIALFAGGEGWHVRDLQRAAGELGHRTSLVDFREVTATAGCHDDANPEFDAAIVRSMPPGSLEQIVFRMDVLQRMAARGIPILNPPRSLETCIDKYLASAKLEAAGLKAPATIICQDSERAMQAFDQLGGDVVVKPIFGSEGRGMMRIDDADLAWRTFRTLERLQHVLYIQQFIDHPGWDLRIFVMGKNVRAAMKRYAKTGWRTNVAQGGSAEPADVSSIEEEVALRAARATGLLIGGIDLLRGPDEQWYVLEVNAVPGWRKLSGVCDIDVAKEVIEFTVELMNR